MENNWKEWKLIRYAMHEGDGSILYNLYRYHEASGYELKLEKVSYESATNYVKKTKRDEVGYKIVSPDLPVSAVYWDEDGDNFQIGELLNDKVDKRKA